MSNLPTRIAPRKRKTHEARAVLRGTATLRAEASVRVSRRAGAYEVAFEDGPGASGPRPTPVKFDRALNALTGMTARDREVVEIRDGLRDGGDPRDVLRRVARREPTPEQVMRAAVYVDALHGRGPFKPAACFRELCVALGVVSPTTSVEHVQYIIKRARRRLRRP